MILAILFSLSRRFILRRRLLLPRQTGLLLGFADEAHGSVERAVVAVGGVAGDGVADL